MTNIPEQTTIKLPKLQLSALRCLLNQAPPDFTLDDLLQMVVTRGIASVVKGRELPGIGEDIRAKAEASPPCFGTPLKGDPRVVQEWLGFAIDEHADRGLDELAARHPLVEEDELCRIVLSAGLRAIPNDRIARMDLKASACSVPEGDE